AAMDSLPCPARLRRRACMRAGRCGGRGATIPRPGDTRGPLLGETAVATNYRFSFGPWNLHEGADPFGPPVRPTRDFADKLQIARRLGFQAIQFHDDDVVPADMPAHELERGVGEVKRLLEDHGLEAEFIAPRLWEDPR